MIDGGQSSSIFPRCFVQPPSLTSNISFSKFSPYHRQSPHPPFHQLTLQLFTLNTYNHPSQLKERKPYRKKILIDLFISLFDIKIYLMECSIIQFSSFLRFHSASSSFFTKKRKSFLSKITQSKRMGEQDDFSIVGKALNVIDLRYCMVSAFRFFVK
jgi:hypothetical protein